MELKWNPRKEQIQILDFFKESIKLNKKFTIIDAPTGVGKSFSVMMIVDWYLNNVNKNATFDIVTNTKVLQSQYKKDFEFLNNIVGKSNYKCETHKCSCDDGQELNKIFETTCETCPYAIDMNKFLGGQVSLTNFHYFITLMMYASTLFNETRRSDILFVDEAHSFEEVLCDFLSSKIDEKFLEKLGIENLNEFRKIKDINSFTNYMIDTIMPVLEHKCKILKAMCKSSFDKDGAIKRINEYNFFDEVKCKFNRFLQDNYKNNWIFTKNKDNSIIVEPIWVRGHANIIWNKYKYIVFMSGTIISKDIICRINGIDEDKSNYLILDSPFPTKNRKIHYLDVGKLSFQSKDDTYPKILEKVKELLEKHKTQKGIIHTVNYEISNLIKNNIENDRLIYHTTTDREEKLNYHITNINPTVIVSPSMINGIDLKDDLSRFQIIIKVPFPNLSNKRVNKRLFTMNKWYSWRSMADVMQAYGRSIRSTEDYASTYILDSCFKKLLNRMKKDVPKYFLDAIDRENT